jgi:cell division protein FtsN
MKKILFLLAIITLTTTSCEYLRKKGIIGKSKNKELMALQNKNRNDSIEFADKLERLKKESQAKIDSVQKSCGAAGKYHVIAGSFMNPANADNYNAEMTKMGYHSQIINISNGFNLVSVFSSDNYQEMLNALTNARGSLDTGSWLYIASN